MSFNIKEGSIKIVHPHQNSKKFNTAQNAVDALKINYAEVMITTEAARAAGRPIGEGQELMGQVEIGGGQYAFTSADQQYLQHLDSLAQNANPPGTADDEE